MTLGQELRAAREAKQMSLRALADAIGVSAAYLCDVEHDRRTLSLSRIAQAAQALDIAPEVLEASKGYTRDLAEWLAEHPEIIALLRCARATGAPVRIGEHCGCCRSAGSHVHAPGPRAAAGPPRSCHRPAPAAPAGSTCDETITPWQRGLPMSRWTPERCGQTAFVRVGGRNLCRAHAWCRQCEEPLVAEARSTGPA